MIYNTDFVFVVSYREWMVEKWLQFYL